MAIVGTAKIIPTDRGGEEGENGLKTFFATYLVITDSPLDGPNTVLGATGLPALHDSYAGHPTAICVDRIPTPVAGTRLAWHVQVVYSTRSIDRDENPLLTKPEIEFGFEPYDEPLPGSWAPGANPTGTDPNVSSDSSGNPISGTSALFGKGVLNAAGDPFDPPATTPNYYPVVRFTRNESDFSAVKALYYGNTINSASWNGLFARQAWLKPIEASNMVQYAAGIDQPDVMYWRVRYTFVLKAETWILQLLNIGPNYLDVANTSTSPRPKKYRFIRDGQPFKDLLKADGTKYASTEEKVPTYVYVRSKREVDFSGLGINLNLPLNSLRRPRI